MDTWAATYAANGNFPRAIELQKRALYFARTQERNDVIDILQTHLESFEAGANITDDIPSPAVLALLKTQPPLLDVRAPAEYRQGKLLNSFNAPILNDAERELVAQPTSETGMTRRYCWAMNWSVGLSGHSVSSSGKSTVWKIPMLKLCAGAVDCDQRWHSSGLQPRAFSESEWPVALRRFAMAPYMCWPTHKSGGGW